MSERGYSSQVIGKQSMKTVFDPQTKDIANGHTHLPIVDGPTSPMNSLIMLIIVICLPPHTTHALQTLDVLGFAQFRHYYPRYLKIMLMMALVQ